MPRHPRCTEPGPHPRHDFIIIGGKQDGDVVTPSYTQATCPGEPPPAPPLHGHGDGPHPDSCWQCWRDRRWGTWSRDLRST